VGQNLCRRHYNKKGVQLWPPGSTKEKHMPLFPDYETGESSINAMLADILIERLNKLIEDPAVRIDIGQLFEIRMPVSEATRKHPTLQTVDKVFLGTLGLINGLVGVIPDGPRKDWGYITAEYDDDNRLVKFLRTPMPG